MTRLLFALVFIFPLALLAQDASPSPTPEIVGTLDKVANWLPNALPVAVVAVIGFLIDVFVRRWPTKNPVSILLVISAVLKGCIAILTKLDNLANQIIGQNVKPPEGPKS